MEQSKSLQVNTPNELTTELSSWGMDTFVGGNDIVIPKLLPMQGLSDLVTEGKATMGDFRDSVSGVKLGSITEPISIIPFHVEKVWDILEEGEDDQYKWVRSVPLVEDPVRADYNDNWAWHEEVNGIQTRRVRRMNFYVLIEEQIKSGEALPYVLSFKSTSYREGKKLFTQMFLRNRKAGLPPPAYTFALGGIRDKNEKGTFIVPTVALGPRSTVEQMNECLEWYKLIKKGAVKVDASEDMSDVVDATATTMEEANDVGSEGRF